MNLGELITIKTLESDDSEQLHTTYRTEIKLFSCVQNGDVDLLLKELKGLDYSLFVGKMSENDIMQYRYMAVSIITLATRYAIQGGYDEIKAYSFSDNVIKTVDRLDSEQDIILYIANEILELTRKVKKSRTNPENSPYVRKSICYINNNITDKISVSDLSEICGISSDYLSQIFKKEMGENLSSYILRKKLQKAKSLLLDNYTYAQICEALNFSSTSYFVTSFKRFYLMTPGQYVRLSK